MACSGNLLFTLANGQYSATTAGGTLIVISCQAPGGVSGWILTTTIASEETTYAIDPSSTCDPLNLVFKNVVIDCGTVDITLSSNLGPCQSSSTSPSDSPGVSSSTSPSDSPGVSSSTSGGNIFTACCPNAFPSVLNVTTSNQTGDCTCFPATFQLTYNATTQKWENADIGGTCGTVSMQLYCLGGTSDVGGLKLASSCFTEPQNAFVLTATCDPLFLEFSLTSPILTCCAGSVLLTVTV